MTQWCIRHSIQGIKLSADTHYFHFKNKSGEGVEPEFREDEKAENSSPFLQLSDALPLKWPEMKTALSELKTKRELKMK